VKATPAREPVLQVGAAAAAPARAKAATQPEEFSRDERVMLLSLARQAIRCALNRESPEFVIPSERLRQPRGVFTTITIDGKLRGCVGQPFPVQPLAEAVASTAASAAMRDPRFSPLSFVEFPLVRISLSVLSPIFSIRPDEIELGRHGLLISLGTRHGLLLPQVPVEMGWDLATFLEQTCRKSGLASDAWNNGAQIEAFTTEAVSTWPFAAP
jgi:AmmeMemoRadiSam system protein A